MGNGHLNLWQCLEAASHHAPLKHASVDSEYTTKLYVGHVIKQTGGTIYDRVCTCVSDYTHQEKGPGATQGDMIVVM